MVPVFFEDGKMLIERDCYTKGKEKTACHFMCTMSTEVEKELNGIKWGKRRSVELAETIILKREGMFRNYFKALGDELIKACAPSQVKKSAGKTTGKKSAPPSGSFDGKKIEDVLSKFVPIHYTVSAEKIIDPSGYSPENVDYIAYKKVFRDMDAMMHAIPSELVYGAFFINSALTAVSLGETLSHVANMKKINRFSEQGDGGQFIPAFVLTMDMKMSYQDLKNLILDYYVSRSLDNMFEFDIMVVVNQGIVVKDWREKRSFKILDTGDDTMQWFFILMNEYLDVEKQESLDLRKYVKETTQYREY